MLFLEPLFFEVMKMSICCFIYSKTHKILTYRDVHIEFTNLWKAYRSFWDTIKRTLSKLLATKSLTISVITYSFIFFADKYSEIQNSNGDIATPI